MKKSLKRNVTILLAIVLSFTLMSGASALTLNMSTFMSNMHPLHTNVLQPFADAVKEKTDGRVEIVIHASNSLVAATDAIDAAEAGIVDITFILPAYTPGRYLLSSIEEFPFMFDTAYQANMTAAAVMDTLQEYDYTTLKLLWFGSTDVGQIFSKKPLNSAADLTGSKLRSPGTFYNDVVKALGAIEVSLPVSDLYDALDRGIVDGTFMAITALKSFKLGEVVSDVYMCNMYVTPLVMVMNL
ncbi:MAG TPA: TRAP transporter substrate-binding protein DctP [Candidatus Limiplasma sp.]|nr:TRAP transporter substrate-binding protein DctP [Candidatus Limiplasma sp.]